MEKLRKLSARQQSALQQVVKLHTLGQEGRKAVGVKLRLSCVSLTACAILLIGGPTDTGGHARVWPQHDKRDTGKLSRTVADLLLPHNSPERHLLSYRV